ncbi:MAG: T9SS type A sorting domain-containing protein [Saprospiraceae bacterium]|nr:T9SS type A sorting domain-containing protein [Saprospiraceae bacterium]
MWRTDGTSIGTEIFMGSCGSNCSNEPNNTQYLGGQLFTGTDSLGDELWFTNGLLSETKQIKDIFPGPKDGAPQRFGLFKDKVYFSAKYNSTNRELWVTDATLDGTKMLKDINSDTLVGSDPIVIGKSNDYLFFLAKTLDSGRELWKTDGTPEGTKLVKDINPGLADGVNDITSAVVNNKFLFVANDGVHGREWWVTNGESDGTFLLKDIALSSDFLSGYRILLANDSIVIFWVNDLVHGREIWRTDGTTNGTFLIKDIFPGTESSIQEYNLYSAIYKNQVFFPASDNYLNEQIWVTDGTISGTKKLTDMYSTDSFKRGLQIINNYLYFTAATGEYGYEVSKLLIDIPVATQNPANPAQLNVEVYPNPNTGSFHFTGFLERPSSMQARLLDLQGRVLFTQQFEQIDGAFLRHIEAPQLPTGLYLLNIQTEQGTRTLPISIVKN